MIADGGRGTTGALGPPLKFLEPGGKPMMTHTRGAEMTETTFEVGNYICKGGYRQEALRLAVEHAKKNPDLGALNVVRIAQIFEGYLDDE